MQLHEIIQIGTALLVSLGGGATIIFGFSNWLGKLWASRLMEKEKAEYGRELETLRNRLTLDAESYKIKLKKSEFIFQKQYEATSEYIAMYRSFIPTYSHPDMDWHDACEHIARNAEKIESSIESFMSRHGAVLDSDIKSSLNICGGISGDMKFEITSDEGPSSVNDSAGELFKRLQHVEELLLNQIHSQSST